MESDDALRCADLAEQLATSRTTSDATTQITEHARKHVGAEQVCVSYLVRRGEWQTADASDEAAARAEALQHELGEGPGREPSGEQPVLAAGDLCSEPRWPRWAPRAVELGLLSTLVAPLHADRRRLGSLSLFWSTPRAFSHAELRTTALFARHCAVALSAARSQETLTEAMEARTVTGQAQGVLMTCYGIDAERAFAVLQRLSQDNNVKLRVIAEDVVRRRSLPDESVLKRV